MELALQLGEALLLRQVLHAYLSDLRYEIPHTDDRAMREGLKVDEEKLKSLIARLDQMSPIRR